MAADRQAQTERSAADSPLGTTPVAVVREPRALATVHPINAIRILPKG